MLNKNKLAVQIAQRTGSSREAARTFPYTFCGVLTDALAAGEAIQLRGTGAFALEETPVHKGYHSSRKQPIDVAARKSPVFKAGKRLKEKGNGAGA